MSKKIFRKSVLLLAITSILLFAMSITSLAANGITGLKQTGTSETEIAVEFNEMSDAYGYYVYYAGSDGVWKRPYNRTEGTMDTRSGSATISGLKAATTYKVKVVPVYYENGMFYPSNSQSATIKSDYSAKGGYFFEADKGNSKDCNDILEEVKRCVEVLCLQQQRKNTGKDKENFSNN